MTKICATCGSENSIAVKVCAICGEDLVITQQAVVSEYTKICKSCGQEEAGTSSTCSTCGEALTPVQAPSIQPPKAMPTQTVSLPVGQARQPPCIATSSLFTGRIYKYGVATKTCRSLLGTR